MSTKINYKSTLVKKARERFKKIKPCKNPFMRYGNLLTFWFNDQNGSTHMTQVEIKE